MPLYFDLKHDDQASHKILDRAYQVPNLLTCENLITDICDSYDHLERNLTGICDAMFKIVQIT